MSTTLDTLADAAGIKRADALALWAEVRANQAKLRACPRHDFTEPENELRFSARYTCANCGGVLDASNVFWYRIGLQHAATLVNS